MQVMKKKKPRSRSPKNVASTKKHRAGIGVHEKERNLINYILQKGKPFNISDIANELGTPQGIVWRKCEELFNNFSIVEHHKDPKMGPNKIFYVPTIDCLLHVCYLESQMYRRMQVRQYGLDGRNLILDYSHLPAFKAFRRILDIWWNEPKFLQSIYKRKSLLTGRQANRWKDQPASDIIFYEKILEEDFVKNEPEKAKRILKKLTEYWIRVRFEFFRIEDDLADFYKNLIGENQLMATDPEYVWEVFPELYEHVIPIKNNVKQFRTWADERHTSLENQLNPNQKPARKELEKAKSQFEEALKKINQELKEIEN
jgi:hypothetical protein